MNALWGSPNASPPYDPEGFKKDKYGPGLQAPMIDPIMLGASAVSPALMRSLQGIGEIAPQYLASEAGAIFPEGMGLPKDKNLIKEFGDVLTNSRKDYLRNQQLADWHASNYDWPRVLADKWALSTKSGGN